MCRFAAVPVPAPAKQHSPIAANCCWHNATTLSDRALDV